MTQKNLDGHGGSTVVKEDGAVERTPGTKNPGDPGYADAVKKVPAVSKDQKGTFNRVPSFRDLEQKPAAAEPKVSPIRPVTPVPQGGKP